MIDCLNTTIGLSRNDCDCFDTDKPLNASDSDSGLFLDEIEGLNISTIDCLDDCSTGSLWDLMARAREQAILNFQADLLAEISRTHNLRRETYRGFIGGTKAIKLEVLSKGQVIGHRICVDNEIKGGCFNLKKIGLKGKDTSGNGVDIAIPYKIIRSGYESVSAGVFNYPVSSFDSLHYNDINIELPLYVQGCEEDLFYDIIFELPANFTTYNNEISCGCGGKKKQHKWQSWVDVEGFNADVCDPITGIEESNKTKSQRKGYGLVLDTEILCKTADIICENSIDYTNNPVALTMAYTIRYKAGSILADLINSSNEPNSFTLLDKEGVEEYANLYRNEYENRVMYIAEQIDVNTNDCLLCDNMNSIFRTGILK